MPKLSEILFGKKEKVEQQPLYSPEQMQYMNMLLGGAQQPMQTGFNYLQQLLSGEEGAMEAFEAPAMRQFKEQIMPSIAERFTSVGAQDSSAFQQQIAGAGAGLAENLAALRENLKMQAFGQASQAAIPGLTKQTETMIRPGTKGIAGGLGTALGFALGGPVGGAIGGSIGGAL